MTVPKCNHAHGPSNGSPDRLTTFNKYGELFLSLASNTYWFADMFDLASGMEGEYGASYYGYGFGLFMAILTAPGASYCHAIMNLQHQKPADNHQHEHNHEHEHNHQHGQDHHHNEALPAEQTDPASAITTGYVALHEAKEEKHSPVEASYLSFKDKIMLVGDAITHVGDAAGTVTAIVDAVTKNALPRWGKGVLQCGATLFGSFYTAADVRSCKNAIIDHNKAQENQQDTNLSVARMA
jgi:hypothetical protein